MTDGELARLRERFPILRDHVYLYNCSQGALSNAVEQGMQEFLESWRKSLVPWDEWVRKYELIRVEFARLINAQPDEVAIIPSASAGINSIANALEFDQRNKVVMGEFEFPTMGQIWLAQQARGARVEFISATHDRIHADAYARAIDDNTAIVPVTHVSFVNGFRADVAAITRIAHEHGALVFLDDYQDCGTRPVDMKGLGVDFYVTGTLKYLLGPPGLGFLYVRGGLSEQLTSSVTTWLAQRNPFAFDPKTFDPAATARRFDGGSPPVPNIYAALPALELLFEIGLANVAEQITKVSTSFARGARTLGVDVKTPEDSIGPLIVLRSQDPLQVAATLRERGIIVSPRLDGVRFAFHVYNTMEDVDRALGAVRKNLRLLARI